ncbi:DinB family protein [Fictibacillus barbaricus]|uniref:Damage-inducible protein DinB n=1 Tax=Fictibacillus barbaricus TaxID=182136 RepID=A0ABU1TWH6_9BACL|nr:DinB family protein [Fictibacillus barbaricus]MDR7071558.1 putative damage-inducible protein DinB [Fictibacillus barbaricus]
MKHEITFIHDVRKNLLDTVAGFSDEQLNEKVKEDKWSIMQVLDHLYLIEMSITKTIQKILKNGETVSIAPKPIQYTVDRSTKVEAPSYVAPTDDFLTLEAVKEKLKNSRTALLQVIEQTSEEKLQEKGFPHPIFGLMSLDQWIPFIGYHEKRHIAQIEELIELKSRQMNESGTK